MINCLENLAAIDILKQARKILASKGLKACAKELEGFRLPGEWSPERLLVAREEAEKLDTELRRFPVRSRQTVQRNRGRVLHRGFLRSLLV